MNTPMARHFDFALLLAALALVIFGVLLIYSASLTTEGSAVTALGGPVARQVAFAILGVGVSFLVARTDYRLLANFAPALYLAGLVGLVLVLALGEPVFGARRWITVGGLVIQPSEIAKILFVLALAKYLADREELMGEVRTFLGSLALAVPLMALVFTEPDLGSTIIFGLIWLGMVVMAGARGSHLAVLAAVLAAAIPFALLLAVSDYQEERLAVFLEPERDPFGTGFNVLQAEISVGSGGLIGQGLTRGTQSQLNFVQTQTTDYIFAVLGEELGFVGAMILFALFIFFLARALSVAQATRDPFGRLIATGIFAMILAQVFVNVGVVIRLVPVTGLTLPFVSAGGSSLVSLFFAVGLLESITMRQRMSARVI